MYLLGKQQFPTESYTLVTAVTKGFLPGFSMVINICSEKSVAHSLSMDKDPCRSVITVEPALYSSGLSTVFDE